ncbi:MAG: hypothetical protein RJA25_412 [Bacteroidota bacterium]|jgi:hypothetical protein
MEMRKNPVGVRNRLLMICNLKQRLFNVKITKSLFVDNFSLAILKNKHLTVLLHRF